jgi:hypothetical protein
VAIAHLFEEKPTDVAVRHAALTAVVERLAESVSVGAGPTGPGSRPGPGRWRDPGRSRPEVGSELGEEAGARVVDGRAAIAVPGPLATLLPGGLGRGEVVAVAGAGRAEAGRVGVGGVGAGRVDAGAAVDYLTLALLAGALRQGLWCAAVGAASLGGAALVGLLGARAVRAGALRRLLVVPEPGERWAEVAAVLADGVDLVLLRPPGTVSAQVARRVDARLRQGAASGARHRAALLVLGSWPSARTVLRVERLGWSGLDSGTGRLLGGRAAVTAEDRTRRVRTARVWLPADGGGLAPLAGRGGSTGLGGRDVPEGAAGELRERRLTAVPAA